LDIIGEEVDKFCVKTNKVKIVAEKK